MADEAFRIDVVWTWTLTSRAPKWCCKPKSCQSIYIWVECCCSLHNSDNKSCLLTFKWTFRFEIRVAKTEPLLFHKRVEITSFRMIGEAAKMTFWDQNYAGATVCRRTITVCGSLKGGSLKKCKRATIKVIVLSGDLVSCYFSISLFLSSICAASQSSSAQASHWSLASQSRLLIG